MREFINTITFILLISLTCVMCAKQTDADSKSKTGQEKKDDQGMMSPETMTEIMSICNESFRIEMAFVDALQESGSFPDETDRTPKCYVRCILEKSGVASEEGTYDPKVAAIVFGGERGGKLMNDVEDLAKSCAVTRVEQCKCERAYQFTKCLIEKEIEEYEKAE